LCAVECRGTAAHGDHTPLTSRSRTATRATAHADRVPAGGIEIPSDGQVLRRVFKTEIRIR
jgi:hypothetical protein